MALLNEHFLKLSDNSLFSEIEKKVNSFKVIYPKADLINLGTEDVILPLPTTAADAMQQAINDMGKESTFHGYGPIRGYNFLIDAILKNDYAPYGIQFESNEIFINDGAKCDIGNISNILRHDNTIGITDPTHPMYINSSTLSGRTGDMEKDGSWSNVIYIPCRESNHFIPELPSQRVDIVYLCSPNNPTGIALPKNELKKWVNYAIENDTLLICDSTYKAYIQSTDTPHSIYEIKGARKVAIEICSFSKSAGFTGIRCGYTVVPQELTAATLSGGRVQLNPMWEQYQKIRYNGTSYISQKGAEALYSPEGKEQIRKNIIYYMNNARMIKKALENMGLKVYGGKDTPYLWVKAPRPLSSMKFFEKLLFDAQILSTPGIAYGSEGEGFIRLTAFERKERCEEAVQRIYKYV